MMNPLGQPTQQQQQPPLGHPQQQQQQPPTQQTQMGPPSNHMMGGRGGPPGLQQAVPGALVPSHGTPGTEPSAILPPQPGVKITAAQYRMAALNHIGSGQGVIRLLEFSSKMADGRGVCSFILGFGFTDRFCLFDIEGFGLLE